MVIENQDLAESRDCGVRALGFSITVVHEKACLGRSLFFAPLLSEAQHALDQSVQRRISVAEVREVIACCEVIEDCPDDKYGPSCLVLGVTASGRPLHVHCSHPSRTLIKIITLYEPDPALWQGNRLRRS